MNIEKYFSSSSEFLKQVVADVFGKADKLPDMFVQIHQTYVSPSSLFGARNIRLASETRQPPASKVVKQTRWKN